MPPPETLTVATLLERAARRLGGAQARIDAEWLLSHVLGCGRARLYAEPDMQPPDASVEHFCALIERRASGTPLAYLLGNQPFFGLDLEVTPAVLIPRADTETLVNAVLRSTAAGTPARVLDLGTGSGAIALALAVERPGWRITATDTSEAALSVARRNAQTLGVQPEFVRSDWFDALAPAQRFDVIASNPPYIAVGDPHLEDPDLAAEPREALVSGADGLDALRHIIGHAAAWLEPGGWLWVEHGWDQGAAVRELLRARRYDGVVTHRDPGGRERVTGARTPCSIV